jgi:hypothetical protein
VVVVPGVRIGQYDVRAPFGGEGSGEVWPSMDGQQAVAICRQQRTEDDAVF